MGGETTAGRRLVLLPRSDSFSMSGTFGDWELEYGPILEDNITCNRIMAEPHGTARHLVAEDRKYPCVSLWQTLRESLSLATAAAVITAASEEVAHFETDTVSQRQTCLNSNGVDRDISPSRVMPKDGFFHCGTRRYRVRLSRKSRVACGCLLYTSPSPRDGLLSRMPSSA